MKKWMKGLTVTGIILLCAGTGITALAAAAGAGGGRTLISQNHISPKMGSLISKVVHGSTFGILGNRGSLWNGFYNDYDDDYDDMYDSDYDDMYDSDYDDMYNGNYGDDYNITYDSNGNYSYDKSYDMSITVSPKEEMVLAATYKGVKKIELDAKASWVKVVENADLKDEIAIYVKEKKNTGVRHSKKGDTSVSVEFYTDRRIIGRDNFYAEGIIEIPVGYRFVEADMSVEAGEMEIASIIADDLSLSSQAGMLYARNFSAGRLSMDSEAGGIKASGDVLTELEADAQAGSIELLLTGSKNDFKVSLDNSMGQITVGDDTYSGLAIEKSYGSGNPKRAELDCSAGSILIDFVD